MNLRRRLVGNLVVNNFCFIPSLGWWGSEVPRVKGGGGFLNLCTKTCELGRVGPFYQVPNVNHKGWYEVNIN